MSLEPGQSLGPYKVATLLGEGGMGQVWQATDTQLNRDVALKILPDAFAADPDRLARFKREAQILASLNHPNIAAIYGIEEAEGTRALVLELVEGPTLADRIAKGPIPLDETLSIAKQIAAALEAAHEAGVIHRDLKPANVKVREDGTVKVLDFGLAKAFQPEASDPGLSASPTISLTAAATQLGMVIGTAAYMAPEQASGKAVDKRADVWAFGVVLYEMLTGTRPFVGDDVSKTLARVIDREPDWSALPRNVPPLLGSFLRRCLAKTPTERMRDVGDVRLAMEGAFETPDPPIPVSTVGASVQPGGWRQAAPLLLGASVVAALVTGIAVWGVMRPTPRSLARFVLTTPPDGPLRPTNSQPDVAISPDGTRIVYLSGAGGGRATRQLYLRQVDELTPTPLRGTDGGSLPFFSPDGESVGLSDAQSDILKRVPALGGTPVTICELGGVPRGMSWAPDDTIVFATGASNGLLRVPAGGGQPEMLTTVDPELGETDHFWPEVLPNGAAVLFTAWSGSDETSRIAVVALDTGDITYLIQGGSNPRYARTGHIVYAAGGTLWAVGFDPDGLEVTGNNPVPVVENVTAKPTGAANFALASNGSLVYVSGGVAGGGPQRSLVWVDREGGEAPLDTPLLGYIRPRVSPDGTRVAVDAGGAGSSDIWIHDLARGTEAILTTDATIDRAPLWTPDGERVVFYSNRDGPALLWKLADTPGEAESLMTASDGTTLIEPSTWSADGLTLLFWEVGRTPPDIGQLSMEGDRASEPLLATETVEMVPSISPDGHWIAYQSSETGQREVYVQRFPGLGSKLTVSTDGGRQPVWSPAGGELFYRGRRGMMVVPVETEPMLSLGVPEVLFEQQYYFFRGDRTYDVAPDGQRFLMIKEVDTADPTAGQRQIVLIENWFDELERLVPTN